MEGKQRHRNSQKELLLEDEESVDGISNPSLRAEETAEADHLVQDLKTRRRQRKKSLSKLSSPKEDVGNQLTTIRNLSRQHLQEAFEDHQQIYAAEKTVSAVSDAEDQNLSFLTYEDENKSFRPEREESEADKKVDSDDGIINQYAVGNAEKQISALEKSAPVEEILNKEGPVSRKHSNLRARMRDRLQKAKEEVEGEIEKEAREERRRQRNLRDKKGSIFDERNEEEIERATEEKARQLRLRWQKMGQIISEKDTFIPTGEDAFDFFARAWEQEPEENIKEDLPKEEHQEPLSKTEEEEREKLESEDKQPLLADIEHDEEGYGPIAVRRPEVVQPEKLQETYKKLLFVPPLITVPQQSIEEEGKKLRFLEEEGFYVGVRPAVSPHNKKKMESRLLNELEKGQKWFGEDGQISLLPDPIRPSPSRPPVGENSEPHLETVFKKAVMCEFDNRYIDGIVDGSGNYQLDVDINAITFTHHHLFSREHVLAVRLNQLYQQYSLRCSRNFTQHLTEKLCALKQSAVHLQDYILSHKGELCVSDRAMCEKRLQDYKFEIRQTRLLRDREEHMDRTLLKNIIHSWKEIRGVREQQGCINTTVRLQVISEAVDKAQDQQAWQQEVEEEVEESREEHEEEYARKMRLYKEQMDKWEKQKAETDKNNDDGRYITEDQNPPQPPEQFDEHAVREQIKAKLMVIRRRPGEPKLCPDLMDTCSVTPTSDCPQGEQERRDAVSKCKLFVKILFNNKEVSCTGTRPLSQDFRVNFGQIFNLRIIQWPESIKFQIFESQGLVIHLLAELYAAIPEASVTSQIAQLEDTEFSSDEKIHFAHAAVGSGVPFKFDATSSTVVTLMTSGILSSTVAWAVNQDGIPLAPPIGQTAVTNATKKMDPLAAIGATGVINLSKLAKWFQESHLDPNDPANADFVYLLEPHSEVEGSCPQIREYFRLEQLQEEFDLAAENDFRSNRRFQLLILRDREVAEFQHSKLVAPFEREIPREVFAEYEKKHREDERQKQADDVAATLQTNKFVQKIREQMVMRFRIASHQKQLEDMVIEEGVPNIVMLGISLLRLSEPRRPLKPLRKERKRVTAQAIKGDEVRLLINIIRASNVPVSKVHASSASGFSTARDIDRKHALHGIAGETVVHPYVEVMFQHNTVRTSAGDGPNPSFNEELELPLKVPNEDFSPSTLQTISDYIYLNLFDEVVVDVLEDERQRETAVHQRLEKKWLGNIKIPFSTVYLNGKIDGTFHINTPPVLLGYTYDVNQGQVEGENALVQREETTSLSLFITIEPPLCQPEPMRERFDTNEDEKLMHYADRWQLEMDMCFPKRHYKTSVIDVNGKNVFLTRYFRALKPPPEILEKPTESSQSNFASRYVSLIPSVSDAVVFPGLCDIWSTCDQFLQMLAGDEEEHALLLTNLFLGLGKKAWLLLGSAIPEGTTAYVLTQESDGFYVWNSTLGRCFSVSDSFCPLYSVGCLVNQENIWANISHYEKPGQIDFNISNTAYWRPFFDRSYPNPRLGTIQPEALIYHPCDKGCILDLQEKIEQLLKNKIMEWRSRFITRWNRHCTQIMRKLLPRLEENCGQAIDHQALGELEESFKTYKVSGFPINMPFVDLNNIVEAVYSTGVHSQETSNTEFALAVYVHGYSNSVISVWIYVASLTRIR